MSKAGLRVLGLNCCSARQPLLGFGHRISPLYFYFFSCKLGIMMELIGHREDLIICMCVCTLSHVQLFAVPWTKPTRLLFPWNYNQSRLREWIAISYYRRSSLSRDRTRVSCISCLGRWILYQCTTWEIL